MRASLLQLLAAGLLAFAAALALTPPVARLLVRLGIVDTPSARRLNKRPVPRGGGVALIASFLLSTAFTRLGLVTSSGVDAEGVRVIWIATGLLIAVGLLDDIFDLKPLTKLLGQLAVGFLVYTAGLSVGSILLFNMPDWMDCLATLAWFALIINAFNLIDGLDGLAAGLAFIGSLGLSICLLIRGQAAAAAPLFALMGACLGFLRYNFNPASVFLGDTGAMFLGYVLALVPLAAGGKAALLASVGVPLLAIGVPLFDTILAVWRRSIKAQLSPSGGLRQVFLPDMEHLHHRFLAAGVSQRGAAFTLYVVASVMVAMAVGITVANSRTTGIILIGAIVVFGIMSRQLSRVELWYTGAALRMSFQSKARRLLVPAYVVCDVAITFLAWRAAADLAMIPHLGFRRLWYTSVFPVFFASIFGMLWAFHIYHRIWSKPQLRDYVVLVAAICLGWLLAYAIVSAGFTRYPGFWRHSAIFLLLILPAMVVERAVRVTVNSFLSVSEGARALDAGRLPRAIVYGAGDRFNMFDMLQSGSHLGRRRYCIVGLVDDDPLKYNRYMHGYRVSGGIAEVERLARKTRANTILVMANLDAGKSAALEKTARRLGLSIARFDYAVTEAPRLPARAASEHGKTDKTKEKHHGT